MTGVAAGCSTLTRNAVAHGLDPEYENVWELETALKVSETFLLPFVAHCAVLHYRL